MPIQYQKIPALTWTDPQVYMLIILENILYTMLEIKGTDKPEFLGPDHRMKSK